MKTTDPRPLISSVPAASSENVRTVLDDLNSERKKIPDFQRDSDQWDIEKKSLFVESVLNNLTIPAFFMCAAEDEYGIKEIIDGQQRITTLRDYYDNKFALVEADEIDYLPENSLYYAGKKFEELPINYKRSFESYLLPIINLPENLTRSLRLEIFRRINQAGTPLSAQDIRLAYYGDCDTVTFMRLVGIYDKTRKSAERTLKYAKDKYTLEYPWDTIEHYEEWNAWWDDKSIALGQTSSEMFLWFLVATYLTEMENLVCHEKHLSSQLRLKFSGRTEEIADIVCAQLKWENSKNNKQLCNVKTMKKHFDLFSKWFFKLRISIPTAATAVAKHRKISFLISSLIKNKISIDKVTNKQLSELEFFLSKTRLWANENNIVIPEPKGKWGGASGLCNHVKCYEDVVKIIFNKK